MSWRSDLRAHFDRREQFSLDELSAEFGVVWPEGRYALQECLGVFFQEYGIPIGLLRRDDDLGLFLNSPPTCNPFGAAFRDAAMQDKASELNYVLKKRRRALGRPLECSPMTVGQYVAAWLGQDVQAQ